MSSIILFFYQENMKLDSADPIFGLSQQLKTGDLISQIPHETPLIRVTWLY